jgi:hypothetical protein
MKSIFSTVICIALCFILSGCGGGGTKASAVASATTTTTYKIQLALDDATGFPTTRLTASGTALAKATVSQTVVVTATTGQQLSNTTSPVVGVIVTFTTAGGSITPSSGTSLTDDTGSTQVVIRLGNVAGAYALTAAASGQTATINYLVDNALQPQLTINLTDSEGNATQTLQAGSVATVSVLAQQIVQVVGQVGGTLKPAPNVLITVSTDGGVFDPTTGEALTDATGLAKVRLTPNVSNGAYTISATATVGGVATAVSSNYQVKVPQLVLGSGSPFQAGKLTITPGEVVTGSSATVSVTLADVQGNPSPLPVQIIFTSTCGAAGGATIVSPVSSLNGSASSLYTPGQGCLVTDTIEAEANLPGQTIPVTASGTIKIDPPPASGLVFVSANPATIALHGRARDGLPDQSTVGFRVVSAGGFGVSGQAVTFSTTSAVGGIVLSSTTAVSDKTGAVNTILQSGTVPIAVEVTARLSSGTGIASTSAPILISAGVPEQSGFSLSATNLNIEGGNIDGVTSTLTIRSADHYGNPVPDGTKVAFTTDGGSITPSCTTAGGVCTVTLTSQNPRPANGRAVILATAVGDETFTDLNGNGLYDDGEPFADMGEPFRDDNESGNYDVGEFFVDVNNDGKWNGPNSTYDGSLCGPTAHCNANGTYVRETMVIVFASSTANIAVSPPSINVDDVTAANFQLAVSDQHGNLPPSGSVITVATSNGKLLGPSSYTIGISDAKGPLIFQNAIIGDGTPSSGTLLVELKTPSGAVTDRQITVVDTHKTVTASGIAVNPTSTTITKNFNGTVQTQALVTGNSSPPGPLAGATPIVNCSTGTSTGLSLTPPTAVQTTDATGATAILIGAVTGSAVSGQATCTVGVGTQSATFTIKLQ